MDDFEVELTMVEDENAHQNKSDGSTDQLRLHHSLLPHAHFPVTNRGESDFHKSLRVCLAELNDAVFHHRWDDAAEHISNYTHALEEPNMPLRTTSAEIIWRLGCEILHHHPSAKPEDIIQLYQRMANFGVQNFTKISLDHAHHLMVNGPQDDVRRQLALAESWKYGKQSLAQATEISLIRAYRGFLDYVEWRKRRDVAAEAGSEDVGTVEMHSYFRQASVTLKDIIRLPGVWDPFILAYVEMLEFYKDLGEAETVLKDYAYDSSFPANPNAHVYLYEFLKKHNAPLQKQIKVLKNLYEMVPSHRMTLVYCSLLMSSEGGEELGEALHAVMDLLEHLGWKYDASAWTCLHDVVDGLVIRHQMKVLRREWEIRKALWSQLHFDSCQARKDARRNPDLVALKASILQRVLVLRSSDQIPTISHAHQYLKAAKTLETTDS